MSFLEVIGRNPGEEEEVLKLGKGSELDIFDHLPKPQELSSCRIVENAVKMFSSPYWTT